MVNEEEDGNIGKLDRNENFRRVRLFGKKTEQ